MAPEPQAAGPQATVAVAIICKTPSPGKSKTRLSPPLAPEDCAAISACFIQDLGATIAAMDHPAARPYAVYTPVGSEPALRVLLPHAALIPQGEGTLGDRLCGGITDLLAAGHVGAILINSDSPTLPPAILHAAVGALLDGHPLVLAPAEDGGYTLVGLSRRCPRLFEDIPWSTDAVFRLTLDRARDAGLPVTLLPTWYDVDDAASYAVLEAELAGIPPSFADPSAPSQDAPATRAFVERRRAAQDAA